MQYIIICNRLSATNGLRGYYNLNTSNALLLTPTKNEYINDNPSRPISFSISKRSLLRHRSLSLLGHMNSAQKIQKVPKAEKLP